jgi:hypothetical protein
LAKQLGFDDMAMSRAVYVAATSEGDGQCLVNLVNAMAISDGNGEALDPGILGVGHLHT